jgi:hypothetical protein
MWFFLNMSNMDLVFSLLVHINYLNCPLLVVLNVFSCYYFVMMNSSYVLVQVIEELIELLVATYSLDLYSRKITVALMNMWLTCPC